MNTRSVFQGKECPVSKCFLIRDTMRGTFTKQNKFHLSIMFPMPNCSKMTSTSAFWDFSLQKGAGYHLDLFWVAILMVVCSFMALPWYVAATVISIAHIDSLKMETETSAPGEQPKFLGVRWVVSGK